MQRKLLVGRAANVQMCNWLPFVPRHEIPAGATKKNRTKLTNRIFNKKKIRRQIASASRRRNRKG